jgi:ABC-2 family transporter protein
MRALIAKELREHLVLAGIGLAAGLGLALLTGTGPAQSGVSMPIGSESYLKQLAVVSYVVAAGLGFLLSWKEELRGTWTFLLHRPVSRGQVLAGKLLAGMALYMLATGIPFLALAAWSAVPGSYPAPWSSDYVRAGAILLAGGLPVLVGAFSAGASQARWYTTRFTPVLAAGLLIFLGKQATSWLGEAGVLLGATVLLALGAWSTFAGAAKFRWISALPVTLGACCALMMGSALLREEVRARLSREDTGAPWVAFEFAKNGAVVRATRRSGSAEALESLDGLPIEPRAGQRPYLLTYPLERTLRDPMSSRGERAWSVRALTRNRPASGWVIHALARERVLVAYDVQTRRVAGYLGRNGFAPRREDVQPFAEGWSPDPGDQESLRVRDSSGLYLLDAKGSPPWHVPLDGAMDVAVTVGPGFGDEEPMRVLVRAPGYVDVYAPNVPVPVRYRLSSELDRAKTLRISLLPDGVLGVQASFPQGGEQEGVLLVKLEPSGRTAWEQRVQRAPPARDQGREHERVADALLGVNPPLAALVLFSAGGFDEATLHEKLGRSALALSGLLSLACAMAVLRSLRRRGDPRVAQLGWTAFALLGGLPALVAFIARERAARVPCPSCGAKRVPSSLSCPRCAAGWLPVERRDIDIFGA